ncbi:hypothetical protein H072_1609 [Dactylellina haptotyla CBS 200.50]|uniref:Fork-head domain-containing protein n=1 Tax=Dactylellina haptotyla (strain CBS 200.50) TaxID=1284197 RepID=S8ANJ3_DACHA|nr:hypothetical protein H072_1609 [Dactylellina haptotyla CBS 200.50]
MGLIPQGESQESINNTSVRCYSRRQRSKLAQLGPSNYYLNKPLRPQVHIPDDITSTTSHPVPTVLPSYPHPHTHQRQTSSPSSSSSTNESSGMVWEQSSLPSSTLSEPIYSDMMQSNRNISHQVFSVIAGASPSSTSSQYFPVGVEDLPYQPVVRSNSMPTPPYPMQYNTPPNHGYESPELGEHMMGAHYPRIEHSSIPQDGYYPYEQDGYWSPNEMVLAPAKSSLHHSGSSSDLSCLNRGGIYAGSHYSDIDEGFGPESPEAGDEELPPYAELIYEALKSAPGHQMHLQDIYQWFRDNYAKFRTDSGKGWMNSIRHNLSMNGAFVKVERPQNEPGKGYMWLLAPAALEGGIKSTTRYRKSGSARTRATDKMSPDNSYKCFVTPKRNRTGKRQSKARRTAKKNLQRMQHVDKKQQSQHSQAHEYTEFGAIHTPNMTPDYSPYHSEAFSEALSTSSRHTTPMRPNEWHSPISVQRHVSPFYAHSDDGFGSSYDNSHCHGFPPTYTYECKPHAEHSNI